MCMVVPSNTVPSSRCVCLTDVIDCSQDSSAHFSCSPAVICAASACSVAILAS